MDKEEKKMKSALAKKYPNLNTKIDYKKLLNSYELPKSKDGAIILNPNNPNHVRWMEEEDGEDS